MRRFLLTKARKPLDPSPSRARNSSFFDRTATLHTPFEVPGQEAKSEPRHERTCSLHPGAAFDFDFTKVPVSSSESAAMQAKQVSFLNTHALLLPRKGNLGLGTVAVSLHYASPRELRWLYWKLGVRVPGTPPDVAWGKDGSIPNNYRKTIQFAFDMVYRIVSAAKFATQLGKFKKTASKVPQIAKLNAAKIATAVRNMVIHLADTSKNAEIRSLLKAESNMPMETQTAGVTILGTNNVYLREFAIKQGIDTLASLILHESLHVAGVPMGPMMIFEPYLHGLEAEASLPQMMGGGEIKPILPQPQGVSAVKIDYQLWKIGSTTDLPAGLKLEILDDERNVIYQKKISNSPGKYISIWDGKDQKGKPVSWGLYTVRIVSPMTLHSSTLLEIKRYK